MVKSANVADRKILMRLKGAAAIFTLAAVYYGAGKFGLSLASINASATAVWPPTGLSLAALLIWGNRLWPGILLGALLVNLTTQGSWATVVGIAVGNTLEGLLGAFLVRRFADGPNSFERARNVFKFTALAAFLSTAVSASIGVTSLCWSGFARWEESGAVWLTWWLGDMVSNLVLAPAVLIWWIQGVPRLTVREAAEAVLLLVTVFLLGDFLFLKTTVPTTQHLPLGFLAIPPLIWGAFRFGPRGAITSALLTSVIALKGTLSGLGPFVSPGVKESLVFVQAFMGTSTLTALVLAGVLSERRQAEGILRESEERFRAFFDNAVVGAVQLDERARIAQVNDSFCRITGYSREELVGMDPLDLDHPEDREIDREHVTAFFAGRIGEYDLDKRYVRKTGEVIWVHVSAGMIRDAMGRGVRTASIVEDITARRKAEEELDHNRRELAAILESAMDAIITIDEEQRIVMFNPAAVQMFGLSAEQALGQPISRFIPERFRRQHGEHIRGFGESGRTPRTMGHLGALKGLRSGGQEFPIEAAISQVQVGRRKFFSVIVRDITEQARHEQALQQARDELARANADLERRVEERTGKLREMIGELEHFSYAIVHDLRAPLRAMQSFADLTEQTLGAQASPAVRDYLQRIRISSERMDALVLDALSYNRAVLENLPLESVDLGSLVEGIIRTYPDFQPPRARVWIEGSLPRVIGNKAGLTQVFSNLLGNAVKFVAPGVHPQVRIRSELPEEASSRPNSASGHGAPGRPVRVWVEDNGIGIPREWQHRIFDMFQRVQTGYEGTGIGLAIVRKMAERMGGRVGVDSEPGKGSRFWLELPQSAAPDAPQAGIYEPLSPGPVG